MGHGFPSRVGFSIGTGFSYGFFPWIGVLLWGFLHGSEVFPWSFPKEVPYVTLDSVDSNDRVY